MIQTFLVYKSKTKKGEYHFKIFYGDYSITFPKIVTQIMKITNFLQEKNKKT